MEALREINRENEDLKKIHSKLLQWSIKGVNAIAPMTQCQLEALEALQEISFTSYENDLKKASASTSEDIPSMEDYDSLTPEKQIETTDEFLCWSKNIKEMTLDYPQRAAIQYKNELVKRYDECEQLRLQVEETLTALNDLEQNYNFVSNKTSALNATSENLISEQNSLNSIGQEIKKNLYYFHQIDQISKRLQNPTISPTSESFLDSINKIDECLKYFDENPQIRETHVYKIKYKQCLSKAVTVLKTHVFNILTHATNQVLQTKAESKADKTSDAAFALYYGKFQASSSKIRPVIGTIEERIQCSSEYGQLQSEIHQFYFMLRNQIMTDGLNGAINNMTTSNKGDHCVFIRSASVFLIHLCQDEIKLFHQFFSNVTSQLTMYLEGLCSILYDTLRPYIIHIVHLETLVEICCILRNEILNEYIQMNPVDLEVVGKTINQLLEDVQERLVFRAHMYLQSDIANYRPSPGDLAYPEKLEMMESIANSLQETATLQRSDSRASMMSMGSMMSQETRVFDAAAHKRSSPADMHGMWYPTVRRTLVCLSRLYRCVDTTIFQDLSQKAISFCIQSIATASQQIAKQKTPVDGELFEIKHLLILREQIAPFRVDFTVKETSLDFSKIKTAAFELLHKRKQIFSLGTNNAIIEFLLEGTPQVKEQMHDSRKDVDKQLKAICEMFIRDGTQLLVQSIVFFLEKSQSLLKQSPQQQQLQSTTTPAEGVKVNFALRESAWASPQLISGVVQESIRVIKSKLPGLQRSMQLYLSNRDTEFVLFRPIRNNVIGSFVKLEQMLSTNGYSKEDLIICGCPSADQISVLLSSASILADQKSDERERVSRKISTISTDSRSSDKAEARNAVLDE